MLDILATPAAPPPRAKPPLVTAANPARWPLIAGRDPRIQHITEIPARDPMTPEYLGQWRRTRGGRS